MKNEGDLSLSVVIPTLNEECNISRTLSSIQEGCEGQIPEIIIADGGSSDKTVKIAKQNCTKVIQCDKGRGKQLNSGWRAASGEWILFLHSDCVLPQNYHQLIKTAVSKNPKCVWGCFDTIKVDFSTWTMSVVEFFVKMRTRFGRMPYGDQGIFVKRRDLQEIGGVKEWPLMEDVDLVHQLNKRSRPIIVKGPLTTSGRRWKKLGVVQTTMINWSIIVMYYAGVDVYTLAKYYYRMGQKYTK
eukprot:TRINITY_DN2537_c0_g1_i6.p2 TRINITY_DN2537_c0_g1~~TRINITY_DN2537_c0_g1_i6.p2  ORF type:complete len:242 (-),score=22.39 TRINITY_DN2537_c0_g1_i6:857-1582(-)